VTDSADPSVLDAPDPSEELRPQWLLLTPEERLEWFGLLAKGEAEEFFLSLASGDQSRLLLSLTPDQRRSWMRLLPLDDAADAVQAAPAEEREGLISLLDPIAAREVRALIAYAEDDAGGLMSPRYARVRPDMSVDEAIHYLRAQARERLETIYYAYVLDPGQHLLGVVSFRELFAAPAAKKVRDVMRTDFVMAREDTDQEALSRLFAEHDLIALPVVDAEGRMKGIVTVDDIVDVVQEEATEDIQKIGGTAALEAPYLRTSFRGMIRKRAGWLAILFVGEMLTASAMANFQDEIAKFVVLALFVPLIISSGGNSGSQASTLVIRAMALGEVHLIDWWRVMRREIFAGFTLGAILACIGFARILIWQSIDAGVYGEHYLLVALTVAASVVGVVTWGTLAGSMLPFILRRLHLDPASASAPFVATLVDVMGLVIYFATAKLILHGTLL
jgi:magnesium transporter